MTEPRPTRPPEPATTATTPTSSAGSAGSAGACVDVSSATVGPAHPLHGDAAIDLLLANTAPSQSILDLDHDPVLRAAAATTGRRYRTLPTLPTMPALPASAAPGLAGAERPPQGADLIVLTWPRPHASGPDDTRAVLAAVVEHLAPGGHVAVLLDPTLPQPYTVTWTGALLTAAHHAGLDYLQDVVCLHTPDPTDTQHGDPEHPPHHRVVLVLRTQAGRHA